MSHPPTRHSDALLVIWRLAGLEAAHLRATELEPVHFFLGLLKIGDLELGTILEENTTLTHVQIRQELRSVRLLVSTFSQAGLDTTQTRRKLRRSLPSGTGSDGTSTHLRRSIHARQVFTKAETLGINHGSGVTAPLHLLASILETACPSVTEALEQSGVSPDVLSQLVNEALDAPPDPANDEAGFPPPESLSPKHGKDTGFAERFGRDLTRLARLGQLSPVIGRQSEMRSLVQTLLRSRKNNAILTGEAGVGKTGIVEGLAQRIAEGQVPPEFTGKRIVEISMGNLVSGTKMRGDLEQRLQALIDESSKDSDLILFIDEIHLLAGAGQTSGSAMDAANLLKPALARGEVRVIGATTTREFRKFMEVDPALTRRFEVIEVSEPDRTETIEILRGLRPHMEEHHGIKIQDDALAAAVDFTTRHLAAQRLPDKAIDVLDQACARARMKTISGDFKARLMEGVTITRKEVAGTVAHRCGVPVGDLEQDESERLLNLESELAKRVKGQAHAIRSVSEAIRLSRAGLKNPARPIAAFLFAGPSGTGKTELSKALAECLFGNENQLIRLDMSEYMEAHSGSKLIGSPPGFVGYQERGQLTEKVRSQPHCVLLLDEVEKAHPNIWDLFLQVFDNGSLTDAHGMKCDFRETIIIMTSNLGASPRKPAIGFGGDAGHGDASKDLEDSVRTGVKRFFRAEFLNRLTKLIVFHPLEREHLRQILDLILLRMNERLRDRQVRLELAPHTADFLIENSSLGHSGARGLERIFEDKISIALSRLLIEGRSQQYKIFRINHDPRSGTFDIQGFSQ